MPRQPTSVRASSEQSKCPECNKTMSAKSIKRHMDNHRGINYPCRFPGCGKPFSQVPNRDQHEEGSHNGRILVCDVCPWSTRQNAEMTRHKQDKHGHPRRGAEGGRKVGHSMKTVAADTKLGVQRSRKCNARSTPYTRPTSSSRDVSPSTQCSSSTSFESLITLSPSPSSSALSSPDLLWSHDQTTFFESPQQTNELDGSYLFHYDLSESFTDNPFNDPEDLQKLIASMPDVGFCPPAAPLTLECTPPMSYSSSTSSDDTDCFPLGLSEEQWAAMLQLPKVEDVNQVQLEELDWWQSVSGDGAEFLNEPAMQFVTELPMLPPYDQFPLTI